MTFTFEEVLDLLRCYEYEKECEMDYCIDVNSYSFICSSNKYEAVNEIRHLFYEKAEEKFNEK